MQQDARRCWDVFYRINKTNFFKDRHYLDREWPQVLEPGIAVLDLGVCLNPLKHARVRPRVYRHKHAPARAHTQ